MPHRHQRDFRSSEKSVNRDQEDDEQEPKRRVVHGESLSAFSVGYQLSVEPPLRNAKADC
jgi:hypothetical protein